MRKKEEIATDIGFVDIPRLELPRLKDALELRNLTAEDVVNVETMEQVYRVWYRCRFVSKQ